jgi:predicted transcriptional regulator
VPARQLRTGTEDEAFQFAARRYVDLNEWQIEEIEAGIAELEAGEILAPQEAEAT